MPFIKNSKLVILEIFLFYHLQETDLWSSSQKRINKSNLLNLFTCAFLKADVFFLNFIKEHICNLNKFHVPSKFVQSL